MPCRTLFISSEDFKNRVDISDSVLSKYIVPNIAIVQDRYMKKILCKDFYDELIEQIDNDTLTSANETLVDDYIKPAMVYRCYARYIAGAQVYSTPSGYRKYLEDNSEAASNSDLSNIMSQADSDAQYYENELKEYLENNSSDYSTWNTNCNCVKDDIGNFKITKIGRGKEQRNYTKNLDNLLTNDCDNCL